MKTIDEIMAELFPVPGVRSQVYELGCRIALEHQIENDEKTGVPYTCGTALFDAYCYGYEYGLSVARGLKEESGK